MAGALPLDALLAARTVWHAGRGVQAVATGEPSGHAALDAVLPEGGWPRGALTELLLPADGIGELTLLLPALARMSRRAERIVLVAPPCVPYAPAWQAAGVDLAYLAIVDAPPRDALWAFEQCLRSATCAAVVGWPSSADDRALRRLQVAADTGGGCAFAVRESRHAVNASPAALRLEYSTADTGWRVRKCRGVQPPAHPFRMAH